MVKELVENALDAGAKRIDVLTDGGGRRLIRVTDDGAGMTRADLDLCVDRHATSKLDGDDLLAIDTLGFRGEALPSIGAVARLIITTRHATEPHAWTLTVDAGEKSDIKPAALTQGTTIEVRDLFYATPGAPEVSEDRPQRSRSGARSGAPPRHEPARCRLHAGRRRARAGDLGRRRQSTIRWRGLAMCSVPISAPTRSPSTPSAKACASPALPGCRHCRAPIRSGNICSSMAARCATNCWSARCAALMPIICRATVIRCWRCSSRLKRARSTSTCIRPKPKCASAMAGWCAG